MRYFDEEDIIAEYEKQLQKKDIEIERLNKGYCELKEKCDKGECDCTHEEYNNMCKENIKLSLKIDELTVESTKWESKFYDEAKKVDKAIEYIENNNWVLVETLEPIVLKDKILNILKGSDKE